MIRVGWIGWVALLLVGCAGTAEGLQVEPEVRDTEKPKPKARAEGGEDLRPTVTVSRVKPAARAKPAANNGGPEDPAVADGPETAGNIEDLAAEVSGSAKRLLDAELAQIPANPGKAEEPLDWAGRWTSLHWGNRAAAGEYPIGEGAQKRAALRVAYRGGKADKAAVSRTAKLSLARSGNIGFDVYALGKLPVNVAVALFVTRDRVYYESAPRKVEPGQWTRLEFDLAKSNWKCASSEWKHNASIWRRDDVRELVVLIYNGKLSGTVYVGNISADQAVPEAMPPEKVPAGAVEAPGEANDPVAAGAQRAKIGANSPQR